MKKINNELNNAQSVILRSFCLKKIMNTGKISKKIVDIGPTQRKIDLLQVACGSGAHSISVFKRTKKCAYCGQKLVEAKKK